MRRHLLRIGHGLGTTTVFALALAGGAIVHLDVPLARRLAVARTNLALAPVFEGRIEIVRVESISAGEITGAEVDVFDPGGTRVLHLEGAHVKLDRSELLSSLVGDGDVVVSIPEVAIGKADVNVDADPGGGLRLARAFVPRKDAATAPAAGRGVRLSIPSASVGHASVHGDPGAQPVDADVDDLLASVSLAPGKLAIGLPHASIEARGLPRASTARGALVASYAQPSPHGGDRFAGVSWQGTIGGIAESVHATYDGGAVEAVVDVPATAPEAILALWSASPLRAPAAARIEVRGTMPDLFADARITAGQGSVFVAGPVAVGEPTRASLRLEAKDLDASAFAPGPATSLGASGRALVTAGRDGAAGAVLSLEVPAGTVGQVETPPVSLVADARRDAAGATQGSATIVVNEPGAQTQLDLHLAPKGSSPVLAFDAVTRGATLGRIRRVGEVARGQAAIDAHGSLDLQTHALEAKVAASLNDAAAGGVHVGSASLRGRASGSLEAPSIDADAHASGLTVAGVPLESLEVKAHGPPTRAAIQVAVVGQEGRLDADTTLDLTGGTTLRKTKVDLAGRGEHVTASASVVAIGAQGVRADEVLVSGLGDPLHGEYSASPGAITVRARTRGLELARLAHAAGIVRKIGGRVAFDIDGALKWNSAQGRFALDLEDAKMDEWEGAKAHIEASLQGRRVTGRATASLGDIAELDLQTKDAEIGGGGPMSPGWWRHVWGEVDMAAKADLAKLSAKFPSERPEAGDGTSPALPGRGLHQTVAGRLDLDARLQRDDETDETPLIDLKAATHDLVVSGGAASAPWRLEGVDATVDLQVDGETGHTAMDAQLSDRTGLLADFNLASDRVPYRRFFNTTDAVLDIAADLPFTANFTLPERDIATLPSIVKTGGMHGDLKAGVQWIGSISQPKLSIAASVARARADVRLLAIPLDLSLSASYDGATAEAETLASAHSRRVLGAKVVAYAKASDVLASLAGSGVAMPWKASASADLDGFPLQSIGALDDHQVKGLASGHLSLDGLHDDAKANVALKIDGLTVGEVACKTAQATASVDGTTLDAALGIEQEGGSVAFHARAGTRWGSALAPEVDATRAADISLVARRFRAELLQPFLASVFAQLDGRVDADARLSVDPVSRSAKPQGTISLSDGTFEMASFGGEFHDVAGKIVMTPDGIVKLEDATMHGLSGKIQAAASARLDGLSLVGARADVLVPKSDPLPLVLDGVQAGSIDGKFAIAADRRPDKSAMDVTVDVPTLHVQLPTTATHDVQALGDLDGVKIGVQRGGQFVPVQLDADKDLAPSKRVDATSMKIAVKLGDVQITRGTDLDARITGAPTITIGNESRVTGQVRIVRGDIDVQGKPFTIENGTVSFVGDDASNPQVSVTAAWQAEDGTRIFADFVGPLRTAKLTLRSDPARSKNEILALILYGTVDAQTPNSNNGMTAQSNSAVGAAGGAATGPVNKALGSVNKVLDNFGFVGGLVTKIDTSSSTPRPEVEIQIARDISVQVAWVLGVPPPGANPDSTLFTLNWRFWRKFQLETTVGDAGTTLMDLVWQHRY
jgi:translocation and assembly module TamB